MGHFWCCCSSSRCRCRLVDRRFENDNFENGAAAVVEGQHGAALVVIARDDVAGHTDELDGVVFVEEYILAWKLRIRSKKKKLGIRSVMPGDQMLDVRTFKARPRSQAVYVGDAHFHPGEMRRRRGEAEGGVEWQVLFVVAIAIMKNIIILFLSAGGRDTLVYAGGMGVFGHGRSSLIVGDKRKTVIRI